MKIQILVYEAVQEIRLYIKTTQTALPHIIGTCKLIFDNL
jgi:hypothetical protein